MFKPRILRSLLAAVALLAASSAGAQAIDPDRNAADADRALDRALQKLVAVPGGPLGVIAIVQRGDDAKVHSFGVGNVRTGATLKPDDHMRVASVAKAFSGAAALALVSERALSLDTTIGERLPDLPDAWAPVTLRQLLGHTSGLFDFSRSRKFQNALFASLEKAPPPEELLGFIRRTVPDPAPGTAYNYSNTDNVVVALMVQATLRTKYPDALEGLVYAPLGLTQTSLPRGPQMPKPFIHGYTDNRTQPPEDLSEIIAAGWAWASGGVISTPADLNRFIRGYVAGRLFDADTQAAQRDVIVGPEAHSEPPGPGINSAGLAIFRYRTACGTVWGHTGNTPGYTQFAAASRNGRRSVTVSINAQITDTVGLPEAFAQLRHVEELAVCAALAR